MTVVPDKLFVNVYGSSIGGCVGSAYPTQAEADRAASSNRRFCVELGVRAANTIALPNALLAVLNDLAKKHDCTIAQVIEDAIAVHRAIAPDVRTLLRRYVTEHKIKFATAVAESCRGYLTEVVR